MNKPSFPRSWDFWNFLGNASSVFGIIVLTLSLKCKQTSLKKARSLSSFHLTIARLSFTVVMKQQNITFATRRLFFKMLIKVKTLTGKEIEIDIDPNDKVLALLPNQPRSPE